MVNWMDIKWIQFIKESPGLVFYKYKLSDMTLKEIDIAASKTKKEKGSGISHLYKPLKKAYKSQIPISKAKKKDLMALLKDVVIPQDYIDYYTNIPPINEENIINDGSDSESDD
ncbi:unnamed protein product [Euphydryas editha]|uniref:Uncharacterized protein n=1 Tax=Euphydryas editha TaxID=104508 RepID=A0AAU9UNP6_EUPED|nr:unnamed protein product [Euphydryas editha]CAH2101035.1 unnamed protein product [Euphydryas editha]